LTLRPVFSPLNFVTAMSITFAELWLSFSRLVQIR
jgi:hypothetical protein